MKEYTEFKIRKKSGGFRKICNPSDNLRVIQKGYLRGLTRTFKELLASSSQLKGREVFHGFVRGRNAVSGAEQHIGFKGTIMFDLKEFFDSVHISMLP